MALVELEDVAADGTLREGDVVPDAARDDADFVGADEDGAKFSGNVEYTVLGYDEEVAVGRVEGGVGVHGFAGGKDEDAKALFHCRVTGTGDEVKRMDPVNRFVHVKGVPAELVRNLV